MITDTDITKLKKVFTTKDDLKNMEVRLKTETGHWAMRFTPKSEFNELKQEVFELKEIMITGFDKLIGRFDRLEMEYTGLAMSDSRQNRQIEKLARDTGTSLEGTY